MKKIDKNIGIVLRIGASVAFAIMLIGIILCFVNSTSITDQPGNITELLYGLTTFNATSYLALGIFVLLLTPIMRIIASIVMFAVEKDKLYVIITSCVLAIIVCCFCIGFFL